MDDKKLFLSFFLLLRLNVPVNNFSVMSGRSHRFLGITSTFRGVNVSLLNEIFAQGHNTAEIGIEPRPLAPETKPLIRLGGF